VSLTAAGQRKVKPLLAQARVHETQVMGDIGLVEVAQLKKVLERMIAVRG
jgi:DNA-binding MarR family transcriptional regulator